MRSCLYRSMARLKTGRIRFPLSIQKIEEKSDASDLMQRWENGPGYIFLESPDQQEELASYLKDREAEGCEIDSFLFPQRSGCEYATHQSHGH